MAYTAYHMKCHLIFSGYKDFVNYKRSNGTVVEDANSNIRLTLAYNHYLNPGQRVPMIRQGVGNLINCYIDDSTHQTAAAAHPIFAENDHTHYHVVLIQETVHLLQPTHVYLRELRNRLQVQSIRVWTLITWLLNGQLCSRM